MSTTSSPFEQFPLPSQQPLSRISPRVFPGANQESTEVLRELLIHNHDNHHIFFNDQGFHNHAVHHILAIWSLGASGETIRQGYKANENFLKDPVPSPEQITDQNYNEHLGDRQFYSAYLAYFKKLIADRGGFDGIIEEYITSPKANFSAGQGEDMLTRFLSGLVHPIIHTCYGLEFNVPAIVAEGLAMTAVHKPNLTELVKPLYDETHSATGLASRFQSALGLGSTAAQPSTGNVHAFTVFSRILADDRLGNNHSTEADEDNMLNDIVEKDSQAILELGQQWTLNANDPRDVERKIEELQWLVTLMYAGIKQDGEPLADFLLMHLVTSSIFLPVVVEHLTPESKNRLLRAYFHNALAVYIARGRPQIDIPGLYARKFVAPQLIKGELQYDVSPGLQTDSTAWLSLIHTTNVHHDQHLCKIQRALVHYASLYGAKAKGSKDFIETGLKGVEQLDGTLFLKAALISNARMTRPPGEDGKPVFWDFKGFF